MTRSSYGNLSQSFASPTLTAMPILCQCRVPNLLPKPHQIASEKYRRAAAGPAQRFRETVARGQSIAAWAA